ncbi:helix-turn-helix transcriptional regulator [Plantactinospora sp. BB1]|uniref:helix-turn-helix domain-containing protein n=1 Tax=Plantactinospora sp. BB1 TaxID=2071627 RepID=UPI000D164C3D|nr:helix-turn-helix transcriptional regulator [Plantactinospora sp. BB1]AVT39617.1 hypothetical protein C6W10_27830 [Plantactinospora sp. BB1]
MGIDLTVGPGKASHNLRFGELLERLRWKAGMTRADAAAKLGLSSEYLRLIEVGKRTPALGQMPNFMDAYGANAAVERVLPGGDQPDLIVIDPLNGEPVLVEFISRIREARRIALGAPPDEAEGQEDPDPPKRRAHSRPSASRAVELGVVVSLLSKPTTARSARSARRLRKNSAIPVEQAVSERLLRSGGF